MANLNKVLLIGRLTRDPELRYTPSGTPLCEFGLAVNRVYKGKDGARQEETTFVDVTAWSRTAELANQYLKKGRQAFVEGYLKFDQWTSPEGQKRSKLTVVCDNLQFLDGGRGEAGGEGGPSQASYGGEYGGRQQRGGGGPPRQSEDFGDSYGQTGNDPDVPF